MATQSQAAKPAAAKPTAAVAANGGEVQKRTRAKQSELPVQFKYLNAKGEATDRIGSDVDSVEVYVNGAKTNTISISTLKPMALKAAAALAFTNKAKSMASNKDSIEPVSFAKVVNDVYANFSEGKVYFRGEGSGKVGHVRDVQKYVDIYDEMVRLIANSEEGKKQKLAPLNDKQKSQLHAVLEAEDDKAFRSRIVKVSQKSMWTIAKANVDKRRAEEAIKAGGSKDIADLLGGIF